MTTLPTGTQLVAAADVSEMQGLMSNQATAIREMPGGAVATTLTIAAGAVTPTVACHLVDTESAAASDDLTNIVTTNHPDGRRLLISMVDAARIVTIKHNAGGAGQIALANNYDLVLKVGGWVELKRTGANWEEVCRSQDLIKSLSGTTLSGTTTLADGGALTSTQNTFIVQTSIGGAVGSESLRVVPTASAVNYLTVTGATAADPNPRVYAAGSNADVGIYTLTKGAGNVMFLNASAYSLFSINGNSGTPDSPVAVTSGTGVATVGVGGGSTNADLALASKGTGVVKFTSGGGTQFVVASTASAVDYVQITGGYIGGGTVPTLSMQGSEANIPLNIKTKGSGAVNFVDDASAFQFCIFPTASAVNYLTVTGATAADPNPRVYAEGSNADVGIYTLTKGAGSVMFLNSGTYGLFSINGNSGTPDSPVAVTAGTGVATVGVGGGSTNADLALASKGTGVVKFATSGNFAANGAVATTMTGIGPTGSHTTVQEWLVIKNASGTVRYIPCY